MSPDNLEKGLRYLESLGYRVKVGDAVYERYGYLAGDDERRLNDLHAMFADESVQAVFCVRGGYGTPRLLPRINYDLIAANPKILVGYSDITALQLAIFAKTGLVTFSGPMVAVEMAGTMEPATEEHFWRLLTTRNWDRELIPLGEPACIGNGRGAVTGRLIGGCLSLVSFLIGTPYLPDLTSAILFLEDVGEPPYRIDAYLAHLRNAGIFSRIAGLVFGKFRDCMPEKDKPSLTLEEVLQDYLSQAGKPALLNLDYGHGPLKYTLPIGAPARLDSDRGVLELLAPEQAA